MDVIGLPVMYKNDCLVMKKGTLLVSVGRCNCRAILRRERREREKKYHHNREKCTKQCLCAALLCISINITGSGCQVEKTGCYGENRVLGPVTARMCFSC